MKAYKSFISLDLKLLKTPKKQALNFLFKRKEKQYLTDFDYDIFCWLFNDEERINKEDLLFYNNPINSSEIVYLGGDDVTYIENIVLYPDAYIDLDDTKSNYSRIIFSVNLYKGELLNIDFQDATLLYNIVTDNKIIHSMEIIITEKATFYDFLELKKINSTWIVSKSLLSPYKSLDIALKNRIINSN